MTTTATTAAPEFVSIVGASGRPTDADTTRHQIGMGVLMSCGARDYVKDDATGLLMFRVGPNGKRVCKVLVRLMGDDTYTVEYGRTDFRDPFSESWGEWQAVEQAAHVYAESLPAVVRRLGDRERY